METQDVHDVQPTGPNAVVDRLRRQTQRNQLRAAEHTVLTARQLEDRLIQATQVR